MDSWAYSGNPYQPAKISIDFLWFSDAWLCLAIFQGATKKGAWLFTLPETNVASENRPSQKDISIPTIHFQVLY